MAALLSTAKHGSIRRDGYARQRFARGRRALLLASLVLACSAARADWYGKQLDMMGTSVSVELWDDDAEQGPQLVDMVIDDYRRIDRLMSTYKQDSEISRINAEAADHPVPIEHELFTLIDRSLQLSRMSGGAFDITYESVGYLYNFHKKMHPTERQIEARLSDINYRNVELDPEHLTIRFRKHGVRINLGGIAKGYAVEHAAGLLRAHGIEHAVLNAGGDTRVIGDRLGRPWIIGIRQPRAKNPQAVVTRLPLVDEAISTSGDYERFFIGADGKRYHHIMNPKTGEPTTGVISATVIGPDATMTDGLSTTVFVLGPKAGMKLIESLPDYEAVIIDKNDHLTYSSGLTAPKN